VKRAEWVRLEAQDEMGRPVSITGRGLRARVLQHEMDHLDGVLILDRTARDERKQAMRVLRDTVPAALGSAAA
jgi:peptide deformylase